MPTTDKADLMRMLDEIPVPGSENVPDEGDAADVPQETPPEVPAEPETTSDEPEAENTPAESPDLVEYRARLNEMAKLAMQATSNQVAPAVPAPAAPAEPVSDFNLTQEEYEQAINSPEGFAKVMGKIQKDARMAVLREIPGVVERQVNEQLGLKMAVQGFYDANKDLVPYRAVVGLKVKELEMTHPEWTYSDIFKVLGKEVRDYLRIPSGAKSQQTMKPGSPAFPSTKSTRKSTADTRTPLQKELDELSANRR